MEDKVHPLVELVLARIESHPEEFKAFSGPENILRPAIRWDDAIYTINNHGSKADKDALNAKLDAMRMEEAHARMLDELLNGEERRRKEREEYEEERKRYALQQQQAYQQNLSTAIGLGNTTPSTPLTISTAGNEALRIDSGGNMRISNRVAHNPGVVAALKKALGL